MPGKLRLTAIRLGLENWIQQHFFLFAAAVAGILGLLALLAPVELRQEVLAPADNEAKTYFGKEESVGQAFVPLPGMQELRLPIGRQEVKSPFILHLREDYFGEDIRTAAVFEPAAESEEVVFHFWPILNPPPSLLWVLEAPHGPRREYWVYREQDTSAFPEGTAFLSGRKIRGNFAFTQIGSQPKLVTLKLQLSADMTTWEKQSLIVFLIGAVAFLLFAPWMRLLTAPAWLWVVGLAATSIILHAYFAQRLPLIIDEGAYLQDAIQTTGAFWPLRDFLTKGPVYVLLLKIWQLFTPDTLVGWRLFSAVSWAGVVGGVALLARRLGFSAPVQIVAAALLALLPGVVSVTTPLLLQVTSTLFVVLALTALLKGSQENRMRFIVLGALLMAVGYLTRSSTAAAGLAGAVLIGLFAQGAMRNRLRALAAYVGVGLLVMAVVTGAALLVMGSQKTAVLLNIEALTVGQLQVEQAGGVEPVIRWVTQAAAILWRGGAWMLAGVVALPLFLARRLSAWARFLFIGVWAGILMNVLYHLSDTGYSLPGVLLTTRTTMLVIVFGIPLAWLLCSLLVRDEGEDKPLFDWRWLIVCSVWLGALVALYRGWGIYRAHYVTEFLPPLALLAAAALTAGWSLLQGRKFTKALVAGLFLASWWQGTSLLIARPLSGTIAPEAVEQLIALIRREVPPGEEIFTAQPIVTAAARRPIISGYSHPGWILYSRLGQVPDSLRQIYFADADVITEKLAQEVQFVVTDSRTSEVYFDYSPERQKILVEQFELIGEVPNDLTEEPFRLYRRR